MIKLSLVEKTQPLLITFYSADRQIAKYIPDFNPISIGMNLLLNSFQSVKHTIPLQHNTLSIQKSPKYQPLQSLMKKEAHLANDLKKLHYQLSYSEHINRQLSQQLSIMCEKSGLSIKKMRPSENIPQINYSKMLQQLYYVEPLFMAYQHKISLFEQELTQIKQQSDNLTKYAEQLVKQNDFLRKELQRKAEFILKSEQVGININFIKLDNESLNQKNHLLNEKNEYLLQKIKELSKSIDTLKRTQNNQFLISKLEKDIQKQTDSKKQLQIETLDAKGKLEIVNNQLNNEKAMNKEYERKISEMDNQISRLKNQNKILKQQLETNSINFQHTKQNIQAELQTLKAQLLTAQRRQSQLFNKSMILENQLNQKSSKLHNLTLQNTQLQTNNNNILQMLENYQSKVTNLNKKIKSLENQIKQSSDSFTQNRKELEIAQWKLTEKAKQIERKETEYKKQKQRITKMWEQRLEVMRNAFEQEKDRMYDEFKSKSILSVK